ncbi:MAG: AraC family transcriptional regulator [Spirochaetes bacterium]|nr:AraC family transcriptional regulator [Spirochaetota bacterium]MBN2769618.1 AraC family transcriptional regulator [Spirochaetota bacterium]
MLTDIITVLATCAAILQIITILLQSRTYRSVLLSLLIFSLAYLNFYLFAITKDFLHEYPFLLFTNIIFAVNIGPLFFLYIKTAVSENREAQKKDLICFIFSITVCVALLPLLLLPDHQKIALNRTFPSASGFIPLRLFVTISIVNMLIFLFLAFYLYFFKTRRIGFIFKKSRSNIVLVVSAIVLMTVFMVNGLFSFFNMLGGFFLKTEPYNFIFSIIILGVYFLNQRFLFIFLYGSLTGKKRLKNLLIKVDKEKLESRLQTIMCDQRLYCNEDMNLAALSKIAGVGTHQLSQYINDVHGDNFNGYINSFRINEAKRLMFEEPQAEIISIAFSVGFNSYSAFSSAFKKITGTSAANFREMIKKK